MLFLTGAVEIEEYCSQRVQRVPSGTRIPFSCWGDCEAPERRPGCFVACVCTVTYTLFVLLEVNALLPLLEESPYACADSI